VPQKDIFEYIKKAQSGDNHALDMIINENIGLVWSIAKRFYGRGHEPDDLFQIGSIGLIKAIKRFDLNLNLAFSTYAVPMIMGEIRRFLRDDGIIKVSRSLKTLNNKVRQVREKLANDLNREPYIHEIADFLGVESEPIATAFEATASINSINEQHGETENTILESLENDEVLEDSVIERISIQNALQMCDSRERQIIVLRYFEGKTQCEIGKILGISQVQVSRIEKRVLSVIKKQIE